jgi:hypothetical protein
LEGNSRHTPERVTAPTFLCYKDLPQGVHASRADRDDPEAFLEYSVKLALENEGDPSTTPFERLEGKTPQQVEDQVRDLRLITAKSERDALADIAALGLR